jgi:putative methionine-R-sulfoxide reductase with GAF domain
VTDRQELARTAITEALRVATNFSQAMTSACTILQGLPGNTGLYVYVLEGETLVLKAFQGRVTEHTRIPSGKGICGASVISKGSVIVADVASDLDTSPAISKPNQRSSFPSCVATPIWR